MKEIIRNIQPYEQRQDGTCGEASLLMIYRAFGITVDEQTLVGEIKPDLGMLDSKYTGGTLHEQMAQSLRRHNFTVWEYTNFTYEGLEHLTRKGLPVIVEWMTDLDSRVESDCHYSVVTEAKDGYVKIADPSIGEFRIMDRKEFDRKWMGFERDGSITRHWIMVGVPNY